MRVLNETLEPYIETWDDPGDYPSGAGSGPLSSYKYVQDVEGEVTIELEDEDIINLINDTYDPELPHGIKIKKWNIEKVEGRKITFTVNEFEADNVEHEEPDYD